MHQIIKFATNTNVSYLLYFSFSRYILYVYIIPDIQNKIKHFKKKFEKKRKKNPILIENETMEYIEIQ